MIISERFRYILTSLEKRGIIDIKTIASELNISEATVRRDFEKLEREGKLIRVQGGAQSVDSSIVSVELPMDQRIDRKINMREKEMIAEYAADLIKDGECVFLDAGTTFVPLITKLAVRNIKIVTYSALPLPLIKRATADIFVIGGHYSAEYNAMTGALAQEMLARFTFHHAFIGCVGVSLEERTAYTTDVEAMAMKQIAMKNSEKKHLAFDMSKTGIRGFYKFKSFEDFDSVICNSFPCDVELPENMILI